MTNAWRVVRRAFAEFLTIPVLQVIAFSFLSWGAYFFDAASPKRADWGWVRGALDAYVGSPDNATNLLETVATSLITITSITFSILLLAVQQSSAALTNQVVDQYLRRRSNQWFFGFFVGASIYSLNCLALTRRDVTPVLATALALVIAATCVFTLIILIYSTLDQTRPASIVARIHDSTVAARRQFAGQLQKTRGGGLGGDPELSLFAEHFGYVTSIKIKSLCDIAAAHPELEIELAVRLSDPVCHGQALVHLRQVAGLPDQARERLRSAIAIEKRRDLIQDPMFGIDQLGDIAWTSTSTAKSNPAAALISTHALNDLLWRWTREGLIFPPRSSGSRVFMRDDLHQHIACAYESLMVAASESMQHQTLAEIVRGFTRTIPHMPARLLDEFEDVVLRSLSSLGDHVPTAELEREIKKLAAAFEEAGRDDTARKLERAWKKLSGTKGLLHSRSERVPSSD